ncbi:MAG: hypothetical protein JWN99_235 [Ilumatobacteraceae bacterium]|nr:hypothetical protein [Ilumatobacteraceae bacterium]
MHTDIAWQRTIDHQNSLRLQARHWRLSAHHSSVDSQGRSANAPDQLSRLDRSVSNSAD